jgi:hypothetical protein
LFLDSDTNCKLEDGVGIADATDTSNPRKHDYDALFADIDAGPCGNGSSVRT